MKKSIILLLLCSFTLFVGAQKLRHHEFSCALGFGPNMADKEVNQMHNRYIGKYGMLYGGECGDIFGDSFVTFNLEYNYRLNKQWAIGLIMGWGRSVESYSGYDDLNEPDNRNGNYLYSKESSKTFYLAPSLRYGWFQRGKIRLYSRIALGTMRQHTTFDFTKMSFSANNYDDYFFIEYMDDWNRVEEESSDEIKWKFAYQLTAFGFDFGIEPIRIFSELGYGCQGVFTIGARIGL